MEIKIYEEIILGGANKLSDALRLEPSIVTEKLIPDNRGWFTELFNEQKFSESTGLNIHFIQDNMSFTRADFGRGLHFQKGEYAQTKLVRLIQGDILDYAVNIDPNSKDFGKIHEFHLSTKFCDRPDEIKWVLIPKGYAHGFLALENSVVQYKVDAPWVKESERCINMLDTIKPGKYYQFSTKDANAPTFGETFGEWAESEKRIRVK